MSCPLKERLAVARARVDDSERLVQNRRHEVLVLEIEIKRVAEWHSEAVREFGFRGGRRRDPPRVTDAAGVAPGGYIYGNKFVKFPDSDIPLRDRLREALARLDRADKRLEAAVGALGILEGESV